MTITEIRKDLFDISNNEYYYVHCISSDYALGAGIAKIFRDRFNMRKKLENSFPNHPLHKALLCDKTFNLVTKERYWQKPTYVTLQKTLNDLKTQCEKYNIKKLAMPKIGCVLDRL